LKSPVIDWKTASLWRWLNGEFRVAAIRNLIDGHSLILTIGRDLFSSFADFTHKTAASDFKIRAFQEKASKLPDGYYSALGLAQRLACWPVVWQGLMQLRVFWLYRLRQ
jgi:hypothetical protein